MYWSFLKFIFVPSLLNGRRLRAEILKRMPKGKAKADKG